MKKQATAKRPKLSQFRVSRSDSIREKALHPVPAVREDICFERSSLTRELKRILAELEDLDEQDIALSELERRVKDGGRWVEASAAMLEEGQWYILRRTQYDRNTQKLVPFSPLFTAKWQNGRWSYLPVAGRGVAVFVPKDAG